MPDTRLSACLALTVSVLKTTGRYKPFSHPHVGGSRSSERVDDLLTVAQHWRDRVGLEPRLESLAIGHCILCSLPRRSPALRTQDTVKPLSTRRHLAAMCHEATITWPISGNFFSPVFIIILFSVPRNRKIQIIVVLPLPVVRYRLRNGVYMLKYWGSACKDTSPVLTSPGLGLPQHPSSWELIRETPELKTPELGQRNPPQSIKWGSGNGSATKKLCSLGQVNSRIVK